MDGKLIDLTGQKFGDLTVIDYAGHSKWNCQCSCGNTTTVFTSNLKSGLTKSCGHRRNEKRKPTIDLTGQKFGDLTVIDYAGHGKWNCRCSCGKTTTVVTTSLKNGMTKSCGHRRIEPVDLTGQKFGDLTVIDYAGDGKWNCQCSCGNTTTVAASSLKSGGTKSCGHRRNAKAKGRPKIDLTGQKFGDLTVIDYAGHGKWNCQCSCGNTTTVAASSLKSGGTKSCGHRRNAKAKGRPKIDLTGQKFGDLTVIDYAGNKKWNCRCSCGKTTTVFTYNLQSGSTKSCGHNRRIDLTGQKFGDLTAINYAGDGKWNCQCSCGKTTTVATGALRSGGTKSCGHRRTIEYRPKPLKIETNIKGVYYVPSLEMYYAVLRFEGKRYHLKNSKNIDECAQALEEAKDQLRKIVLDWYEDYKKNE